MAQLVVHALARAAAIWRVDQPAATSRVRRLDADIWPIMSARHVWTSWANAMRRRGAGIAAHGTVTNLSRPIDSLAATDALRDAIFIFSTASARLSTGG
jgi:hypothetical protein